MSKMHYEVVESCDSTIIKTGNFIANIEVDDFKWSEITNLIDEFYLQDELPEEQQSPAYKAWMNNVAPLSIVRNNGTLEVKMVDPSEC